MLPKEQTTQQVIKILESDKESVILDTLRKLHISGTVEILPYLFRLYFLTNSENIRYEVLDLLNNLKDNKACPYFIEAIQNYKGQDLYSQIVSSCWQNGLDFSENIKIFIDLVIEQDLYTAIEAFSVVEENISGLTQLERETQVIYIQSRMKTINEERKKLVIELLHLVENIPDTFRINLN